MVQLMERNAMNMVLAAHLGVSPKWEARAKMVAEQTQLAWIREAVVHTKTGKYAASIRVWKGKVDYHVEATDKAAAHIEFGHDLEPPKEEHTGKKRLSSHTGNGVEERRGKTWVRALHLGRNTVKAMHALGHTVRIGGKG
ncbi:DUF5403 family protein [Mobiluncus mulieris]|uniref:DUF5403 family protein n=1 Tax=Mobiluncus mulieris TaxID=2052 RepID=A0A7Y0TX85_9ACTO|nr:DUF5403 family protein [Mobiluncus mulieris]MCU9995410.1 hypothetical protein [Mobiluncus mulieris]NMW60753.1 DUF5403 family protein [Mobiluncus mulieris]NMW64432.1 DUF5403 family protein [Mobiluncus mulieris]